MIQEYLFVNEEHRAELNAYNFESVRKEIIDIENSDCWIVKLSCNGESDESAKKLSKAHDQIIQSYSPTVLINGCSAYYNRALYPLFNEFERKLRKLLYLKSALSDGKQETQVIRDLESKDFGVIFELLFTDKEFVKSAKSQVNGKTWQFTKAELLSSLETISEETLWDKLIGEDIVPQLRSDFMKVKDYRNDIMHAHNITRGTFLAARRLILDINQNLQDEIQKTVRDSDGTVTIESPQGFNMEIGAAIKDIEAVKREKTTREQLIELQAYLSSLRNNDLYSSLEEYRMVMDSPEIRAVRELTKSCDFAALQEYLQNLAAVQANITPFLNDLHSIINNVPKLDLSIPAMSTELQETEEI